MLTELEVIDLSIGSFICIRRPVVMMHFPPSPYAGLRWRHSSHFRHLPDIAVGALRDLGEIAQGSSASGPTIVLLALRCQIDHH